MYNKKPMHIDFSGIGGAGLYPLALLALDMGWSVSGSDPACSANTRHLESLGVPVDYEQSREALASRHEREPIGWLVYSSAIPADSPELIFAREQNIPSSKRHEFITHVCGEYELQMIAVAGTHGKTSTTTLLIWIMQELGVPASHVVGGNFSFAPAGQYLSGSRYFIYEADEYDRNFLHFEPAISLITSLDYDHPDTYPDVADYREAFWEFAGQSRTVITWPAVAGPLKLEAAGNTTIAERINPDISLPGAHNRANASLCLAALLEAGIDTKLADIIAAINTFPGVDRRMERVAENVYSDYAHHPAEIAATLQLASELSSRVVAVYQPHQNIRQHQVKEQYPGSFSQADKVYWLPTFLSREDPDLEVLGPEYLASYAASDTEVEVVDMDDALAQVVASHAASGDMVVCIGAGSIDTWVKETQSIQNR